MVGALLCFVFVFLYDWINASGTKKATQSDVGRLRDGQAFIRSPESDTQETEPTERAALQGNARDAPHQGPVDDGAALYASVEPAVIRIDVETARGRGTGSGFIVSKDGVAVTNFHVVEGAQSAKAVFHDGAVVSVDGVLFLDEDRDIAILKLAAPKELRFLRLSSEKARKGEKVIAVGAPKGLSFSVTEGIVSAVRPSNELVDFGLDCAGTWIQTSAPISPGNSGGPLVNVSGTVIAANTLTLQNAQNVNFAISSIDILAALETAKTKTVQSLSDDHTVRSSKSRVLRQDAGDKANDPNVNGLSAKAMAFTKSLMEERDRKLKQISNLESQIDSWKDELKKAMLAGDSNAEMKHRTTIRNIRRDIDSVIQWSPSISRLDMFSLQTGQIGNLEGSVVRIIQVISKARGECLAIPGRFAKGVKLRGVDLTSTVDDDLVAFSKDLVVEVVGTETYPTVAGGTNTVFVVTAIAKISELSPPITHPVRPGQDEPELNMAEREQVKEAKERVAAEAARKKHEAEVAKKKADDEKAKAARPKAAKAKLTLAKQLIDQGKTEGAKKFLTEILVDYSDTDSAKEAQRLWNTLKK